MRYPKPTESAPSERDCGPTEVAPFGQRYYSKCSVCLASLKKGRNVGYSPLLLCVISSRIGLGHLDHDCPCVVRVVYPACAGLRSLIFVVVVMCTFSIQSKSSY